jgi:ABC-type bacteriocin/lantibiotic exporter with double-glycine peptidase domain
MILQGKNIHFKYSKETIFKDFSFELKEGEKLVLRGESGSGKSTLFRLILGFEKPESGEFFYKSSVLNSGELKSFRKETAWLPQDLNIGSGTVKEVIEYPFQFKSSSGEKPDDEPLKKQLNHLGLDSGILEKTFSDLSTGQRQRIGILICSLMDKSLTLLDEPTSALDRNSKEKLADLLLNSDRTILSTSHDPFWVKRCDRIIEMQ